MDPQATPTRLLSRGPKSILSSRSSMYVTGFFFTEFYLIFLFDRLSVSSNDFYLVLPSYRVFFVGSSSLPTLFHERCCFFYLVLLIYLFHHLCLVGPCSRGRRTTFTEFYRVFWGVHHCLRRWMQEGHSTRAQKKKQETIGVRGTGDIGDAAPDAAFPFRHSPALTESFSLPYRVSRGHHFSHVSHWPLSQSVPCGHWPAPSGFQSDRKPSRSYLTEFYRVLPSCTEVYLVLPSFTELYRVVPSFTELYRVNERWPIRSHLLRVSGGST